MEIVLDVSSAGGVEGMHFDSLDLSTLGKADITRASEIMFNAGTQKWDVILPNDTEPTCEAVTGFSGYDVARVFEVRWLQGCRKLGVQPDSYEGSLVANESRCG